MVVDTTEFHGSLRLVSDAWKRLLDLSRDGRLELGVPEVVLREAERQFRKALAREVATIDDAASSLKALSKEAQVIARQAHSDIKKIVDMDADWAAVRQRLQEHSAEILPIPHASIEDVLTRDLRTRRPFDCAGKGFRDTLIWLSIVEYVQAYDVDEVVFITGNSGDFSHSKAKPNTPHADLVDDLAASGRKVDLVLYASIKEFLAYEHPTRLESALQTVGADSSLSEVHEPTLREVVEDAIFGWVDTNFPGTEIGDEDDIRFEWAVQSSVPLQVTDLTVMGSDVNRNSVDMHQYDEYEGGAVLLRVEVGAELDLEGFMFKPDWYVLGDSAPVSLLDADWNDHMVEVAVRPECTLVFDVLADEAMADIQELTFADILAV